MALSGSTKGVNKSVRLALALGLCAAAAAVLAWRLLSTGEPPVDPEVARKQQQIQSGIESAAPKAPEPEVIHRSRKGGPINPHQ